MKITNSSNKVLVQFSFRVFQFQFSFSLFNFAISFIPKTILLNFMQANSVHMCICIAFRVKTSSEQIERYIRQGTNISEGTLCICRPICDSSRQHAKLFGEMDKIFVNSSQFQQQQLQQEQRGTLLFYQLSKVK